jgi:peptidoglycan/LPS O-acetylase OafA/YrhL
MRAAPRLEEKRDNQTERRQPNRARRYADTVTERPPTTVRGAGLIAAVQGAAGLVVAAVLLFRAIGGADQRVANGFGTAAWFALAGGAVLAAGSALLLGRRWGRGLAVFAELLLLPVSYYLTVGSHRASIGIPVGLVAVAGLGLLFSPAALRWASEGSEGSERDQPGPASSANSTPDTR